MFPHHSTRKRISRPIVERAKTARPDFDDMSYEEMINAQSPIAFLA